MWTSSVVVVLFSTQTLTTPHSPDWSAGSDECCPSSETPALLNPLRMAGSSPAVLWSLEHIKRVLKTQLTVWFGLVEAFLHALTFEYELFLQRCPIAVHFGDDCPDAGGPGFVFFVCPCRWSLAAQEGAHVLRESRMILQQQQVQSLSAHIFVLCLLHSAQTLVHDVRFLDPHVHGGPEAFGESLTSCRKL